MTSGDAGAPSVEAETLSVSVVIANWNGAHHLDECLRALSDQEFEEPFRVVVVDNGSTDGSLAVAEHYRPMVDLVRNADNRGFAEGSNQGAALHRSEFVAFLNNDTVATPRWLAELVEAIRKVPDVGACTSKILSYTERGVIDNVGHVLFADGLTRGRGRLERDRGQFDTEEEVFCASGCACLMRRSVLDDVGGFDERFFAYCEDADLGFRARLRGWRCIYVPKAIAYHKFSASSAAFSPLKALNVERNRLWLAVKNLPLPLLLLSPWFTATRYFWQAWGALSGRGASGRFVKDSSAGRLLVLLLRAWLEALAGLPEAFRQRRIIQRRRTVSTAEVRSWLRRFGTGARQIALLD